MRYMGGKFRQSRAIVECLKPYIKEDTIYVEPFCGGMWSAVRVIKELNPQSVILSDVNKPLMLLWNECIQRGTQWLPIDANEVEANYPIYRQTQDNNDPLTAWYGIALSFGGKWFGGFARQDKRQLTSSFESEQKSIHKKICVLRSAKNLRLYNCSYNTLNIPDGAVVYCDPPYEGRVKAHNFDSFDYSQFWQWVRKLSKRCTVFVSCFDCPDDFETVYNWGDTVVRHLNSKGSDGTCEKLVRYKCKED